MGCMFSIMVNVLLVHWLVEHLMYQSALHLVYWSVEYLIYYLLVGYLVCLLYSSTSDLALVYWSVGHLVYQYVSCACWCTGEFDSLCTGQSDIWCTGQLDLCTLRGLPVTGCLTSICCTSQFGISYID